MSATANPGDDTGRTGLSRHRVTVSSALLLAAVLLVVLAIAMARTAGSEPPPPVPPAARIAVPAGAAERLAGAIRWRTISEADPAVFDSAAFRGLHAFLQSQFPRVHAQLRRETIGGFSLLYTWSGSDPGLRPLLLVAHQDVVPVEAATAAQWQEDPFGGRIVDGFIWGRGAIDNKSAILGTLEAVELLLGEGFRPARTVYLAFGHDEEVGGTAGARQVAAVLRARGVEPELVLDEGGVIGVGVLPGIAEPIALVGVAEKGYVSVELSISTAGGHSSLPPRESAIGILGAAIARLERNQLPARLEGATQQLFESIGFAAPPVQRAVFANLWATRPLVKRRLEGAPATNAMIRTTTATTVFQAGTKENVLPATARAVVNFRILPGDSIADVLAHVGRVVEDERIRIRRTGRFSAEPPLPSRTDSEAYRMLAQTIRSVSPDVLVAPFLVVVITDARFYRELSENVFRFLPLRLTQEDLARMHGTNERIAVSEYEQAIRFYRQLIRDMAGGRSGTSS